MDIASIIGICVFASAFVFGVLSNNGDISTFYHVPSIFIVIVGTFGIVLFRSTLREFLTMWPVLFKMFWYKTDKPEDLIDQLVELAGIARKDGMIALQNVEITNRLLEKGINGLVDGNDPGFLKTSLERDMFITSKRHEMSRDTLKAAGDIAPAMGMIGTLIGLVLLLKTMSSDPDSIGPNMSVALMTTLYGAILANAVFIPAAMKLENHAKNEERNNQLIIEGVMFIQRGGNPRLLADLLSSFLSPKINKKRAGSEAANKANA